ncbi:BTAD domain-containing putative transcriptional regulator [Cohnella rhizosphaerae]|uniref:Bacterial transcriptional activator domain-containing protein n=1 Tax=Cohnella rhizosphaerae TaxID=1457232 RepID=A0A9X4KR78_9BACL|nr:BTAD domain-containing putative transcriptional regulator [Cohnella rhizosphaerae]MDG0809345.1 hypothetical protein [Cohnella rhizosphaerae]
MAGPASGDAAGAAGGKACAGWGEAAAATGNEEVAESYLRERVRLQPLLEEAYQSLIALLGRLGRRAEAEELYRQLERRLASELGIRPLDETLRLLGR